MKKNFYVTTPIFYVNAAPHVGTAYTLIASDCIARFKEMQGFNVHFLTGTDEHGQKVERKAQELSLTPIQHADKTHVSFLELCQALNISNTDFIRTTEDRHKNYVKDIWQQVEKNGYIYKDKYCGWYSVRDEAFYDEKELIDGKAPTGAAVEWVEEESYFFRLSDFEEKLLKFYEENPSFIEPKSRKNEVISFVKGGLKDLSVSRTTFSWGIPVPNDEKHVMYVWFDALFNYISALQNSEELKEFWPCDVHIVGKDILRFHAVYWPAFLMATGLPLPKKVFAHGWLTNEGQKISKSLGNVIDPFKVAEDFGVDYLRYFLMREITFGNDGDFSENALKTRVNAELVNKIGNLSQRVLTFICNKLKGKLPDLSDLFSRDEELLAMASNSYEQYCNHMENLNFKNAIECITMLADSANEYIDHNPPWNLIKSESTIEQAKNVLGVLCEVIRQIAVMLMPIVPASAEVMLKNLNLTPEDYENLKLELIINKPQIVFPRI